ncbi:MAG: ATPase [Desulfobacteraceae bacterium]|nr:MAG: ATPase [Desulfobacteraceae bacterium]
MKTKPNSRLYVGVDVGASRTKVAVLDTGKNLVGRAVAKSGIDFAASAETCLESALSMAKACRSDIAASVSTGYGRKNISFAPESKTEIACHAKACYHRFPEALTIVDIGGQDNKIIKVDENGRRTGFKMNRKCAAGTGAFLEEMSLRLDIPLDAMDGLARKASKPVELGSYCTVFSATEVLEKIRQGEKIFDIVSGLFISVVKRILEMDSLTDTVVVSGGVVAYNPCLAEMLEERIGRPVRVPEHPQYSGAVGAALYAIEMKEDR